MSRVDLQLHSSYSNRSYEWLLRKLEVPESYTSPQKIYEELKAKGFEYITITDHDTIEGCQQINHLPGTFLSEEVTTFFPEDGCRVHLLVWNITPKHHHEIQRLRKDIYELAFYLREEGIVHGVSHPLYNLNKKLTVDHFEKLILLFRVFEGLNGTRDSLAQEITTLCLRQLTPQKIDELVDRHKIEPTHDEPWRKSLIGGSDDHGGLYLGRAWTEVEKADSLETFLSKVAEGDCQPKGQAGDALCLSTSLYYTVFLYAKEHLSKGSPHSAELVGKIAERFLQGQNPTKFSFKEKMNYLSQMIRSKKAFDLIKPKEDSLNEQVVKYFTSSKVKTEFDAIISIEKSTERRTFLMASKVVNDLTYKLFDQFLQRIRKNQYADAFQSICGIIPLFIGVAPYVISFSSLYGNRRFLEETADRFLSQKPPSLRLEKRAWFTDTLEDVNGVARTIQAFCQSAKKNNKSLTVVTSRSQIGIKDIPIKNFPPVGEFELPEYKLQKLSFPPILEMIDYIEREGFSECIISTPGPIGLTALLAAKILGLKTTAIYHTDFPQYVRILTDDGNMETMTWKFMEWFYSQVDLVYVNSEFYRQAWIDRGIPPERLEILPRGIQTDLFRPERRDEKFWEERGATGTTLLYVGRVSKEKELEFLVKIYKELKRRKHLVTLCIVGEGPYKNDMKKEVPDAIFTGILTGLELSIAYASADIFVFPSTTDTFGNVVMEATASGLPVYVSDVGGPKELITMKNQGEVLPAGNLEAWVQALEKAIKNPVNRDELISNSKALHAERSWDEALNKLWNRGKSEDKEESLKEVMKTSKKKTSPKSSGVGQAELFGSAAQE